MSLNILKTFAGMLLDGKEGSDVVTSMQEYENAFNTDCSLQVYVSKVRRIILESTDKRKHHPEYFRSLKQFRSALNKEGVSDSCRKKGENFINTTFKLQYKEQRRHQRKKFCFDDTNVDDVFSNIKLLPDNMESFFVSGEVAESCAEKSKDNQKRRNTKVLRVPNASEILDSAVKILEDASEKSSMFALGFALLITTGRRTAEIFNGRSKFQASTHSNHAIFHGQLKKDHAEPYKIPLLCSLALVNKGLRVLREKQGKVLQNITNDEVHSRYSSNLNKRMKERYFLPSASPHDCRRFYIQAVFEGYGYEGNVTFNSVAMHFLGHENLDESLNYNNMFFVNNSFTHKFDNQISIS